jgi:hypothetical protein
MRDLLDRIHNLVICHLRSFDQRSNFPGECGPVGSSSGQWNSWTPAYGDIPAQFGSTMPSASTQMAIDLGPGNPDAWTICEDGGETHAERYVTMPYSAQLIPGQLPGIWSCYWYCSNRGM